MMKTMWPDRRLIDLLQIEHPLVLAPMAGIGTVELAASVCVAGGLGSIGCAGMEPEFAAKTIRVLRGLTDKVINVNFFCHLQEKTATDREEAWRDRLLPYYRELGINPEIPAAMELTLKLVQEAVDRIKQLGIDWRAFGNRTSCSSGFDFYGKS